MRGSIRSFFILCLGMVFLFGALNMAQAMTEEEMWKQFSGLELNFLTEDTPAAGAIVELLPQFTAKTGIKINVTRANVSDVVTKLMLDLGAGSSELHILYSPRWQIPPGRSDVLVDLRKFESDPNLPKVSEWKGPYHGTRACLETMRRLNKITESK